MARDPAPPLQTEPFLERTMVLIPALNEDQCVVETVSSWRALGAAHIRVVDNASTDRTCEVAQQAGADVVQEPRRGYGAAAWRGLQDLPQPCDWILFSSADGSDRLSRSELSAWQTEVDRGTDLILGDRGALPESRQQLKPVQRLGNRLCCWLIRLGWGARFHDMGSLRLVRRQALESMHLQDRGFGWNIEMQVRAVELRQRWAELPVRYQARTAGTSKISGSLAGTVRAAFGMTRMVAHLWWHRGAENLDSPNPLPPRP